MDYKRKLFTLPDELSRRLEKEHNQSKTVVEALGRYFEGKDGTKVLAKLVQENNDALNELAENQKNTERIVRRIATFMKTQGADIDL